MQALLEVLKSGKNKKLIDMPDRIDNTALHTAAQLGHVQIVKVCTNRLANLSIHVTHKQVRY